MTRRVTWAILGQRWISSWDQSLQPFIFSVFAFASFPSFNTKHPKSESIQRSTRSCSQIYWEERPQREHMLSLSNPSHHIPTKTPIGGDYNGMIIIAKPLQSSDPSPTRPSFPHHRDATPKLSKMNATGSVNRKCTIYYNASMRPWRLPMKRRLRRPRKAAVAPQIPAADVVVPEELSTGTQNADLTRVTTTHALWSELSLLSLESYVSTTREKITCC
jgi:hypothetical protein